MLRFHNSGVLALPLLVSGALTAPRAQAQLAPIEVSVNVTKILSAPRQVLLDVSMNAVPGGGPRAFVLTPPNRLAAKRAVLEAIGITVDGDVAPDRLVDLASLPGITYVFDDARQSVAFTVDEARRLRLVYDARGSAEPQQAAPDAWGGLLNYSLFVSDEVSRSWFRFSGANATLDARLFSPYGLIESSGIVGNTLGSSASGVRLDTSYTVSDADRMITGRLGDVVTSGLAWTRPVRIGGGQVQRDFTLQPALVTQPLPTFAGSAAVPSTVDVFVGSAKIASQAVDAGPYQLTNIPSLTNGTGTVVVTDTTGRRTSASLPLYNVAHLLQPELTSFSLEAGVARRNFGLRSNDYDDRPVASVTFGRGLTPLLTLEGHAEAGAGVEVLGSGIVAGTEWGTFETALSLSRYGTRTGGQVYGAYDVQLWGTVSLHAGTQFATGGYNDLAAATARWQSIAPSVAATLASSTGFDSAALDLLSFKPPRSLTELSVSAPVPLVDGIVSLGYLDRDAADHTHAQLVSASYNRSLPYRAALFLTAFAAIAGHGCGVQAGINIPLGTDVSASVGGSTGTGRNLGVSAQKPLGQEAGSVGWQIADNEAGLSSRAGSIAYRSSYGTATLGGEQAGHTVGATASLQGAIATMGGDVVLGNHVQDSFAVVDTGLPGVAVLQDNRPLGTADPWGHFLVPVLSPNQTSRIAVDPLSLPANATLTTSEGAAAPARASGVFVDFGGEQDRQARTIYLVDAKGQSLPPGSRGRIDATGETFAVGYDGQSYLHHLADAGEATVETVTGSCHVTLPAAASFDIKNARNPLPCL